MAAATDLRDVTNTTGSKIVLTSWKVSIGTHVSNSSILFSYYLLKDESKTAKKYPARSIGTVHEILQREGAEVSQEQTILRLAGCRHPTVMKDLCAECGADLRSDEINTSTNSNQASVSMIHSVPELKVSQELAMKIGKADEERLMNAKKLVLLVDLDQTLIHTTNDNIPNSIKDVYHYQLYGPNSPWYHTRLRPGTREFLKNVSKLYELHICTFGVRVYAHKIASILDSAGKYFAHRILSRDECFNPVSKTANLKALFPCGDSMVCIIDDREDVWNFSPSLIPVKPYHFFQHTGDINAPPGLDKTEQDSDDEEENLLSRVIKSALNKKTNYDIAGRHNSANSLAKLVQANSEVDEVDKVTEHRSEITELTSIIGKTLLPSKTADLTKNELEGLKHNVTEDSNSNSNDNEVLKNSNTNICSPKNENTSNINVDNPHIENTGDTTSDAEAFLNGNKDAVTAVQNGHANFETKGEESHKKLLNVNNDDNIEPSSENVKLLSCGVSDVVVSGDNRAEVKKETEKDEPDKRALKDEIEKNASPGEDCPDGMVDVEDNDDYLLYLEEILSMIHKAYYKIYDQTKKLHKPDLKNVVPYVRMKVLKNVNVVFSGVIPTNMPIEKNKAFVVAKSLGATYQSKLITEEMADDPSMVTTHLIAAHPGTAKVIEAKKIRGLHIVNINWLWSCSERWEHVEERLFPLAKGSSNRNSPISSIRSPFIVDSCKRVNSIQNNAPKPEVARYDPVSGKKIQKKNSLPNQEPVNFSKSYNPLLAFSSDDIADMDKEVEDIFNEESDGSSCGNGKEPLMGKDQENSSSEESLSNDRPHGWKRKYSDRWKDFVMSSKDDDEDQTNAQSSSESEEGSNSKYSRLDKMNPNSDQSDFDESVGSVDEEMAAAIERELLNS